MKFDWVLIYDNSHLKQCAFYEATYRAKVKGGWLVRHEVLTDYQCPIESENRYVDEEGFQNVNNVMAFVADPNHEWEIDEG